MADIDRGKHIGIGGYKQAEIGQKPLVAEVLQL
jgi:hypothetical protein